MVERRGSSVGNETANGSVPDLLVVTRLRILECIDAFVVGRELDHRASIIGTKHRELSHNVRIEV